jgi:hypothetical protein
VEALALQARAVVFRLMEHVSASRNWLDSPRTLVWTEDHHVVVLHKVAGETPVDEPAFTSSGESAGIEDVGFVSFREAEDAYAELKVIVASTLEVDGRILVVVDDDILVGEL